MTMTQEEIRRAALAIHELRKFKNRSAGQRACNARGFHTPNDFDASNRSVYSAATQLGAVDRTFDLHERTGQLPKGSWS